MKNINLTFFLVTLIAYASCLTKPLDNCEDNFDVKFVLTPDKGDAPLKVTITNTTTNISESMTFKWYLDDSLIAETKDAFIDIYAPGIHKVKLLASKCPSLIDSFILPIVLNDPCPFVPNFDYQVDSNTIPQKIIVTNTTTGILSGMTYKWFLDDVLKAETQDTNFRVPLPGIYKIKLEVTNCLGFIDSVVKECTVDNLKFLKSHPFSGNDIGTKIKLTSDSNLIACGITDSTDNGITKIWIGKIDLGVNNILRERVFEDKGPGEVRDIIENKTNGNYVICGTVNVTSTNKQVVVAEFNSETLNTNWSDTFGGTGTHWGLSIMQTNDNGFLVTGCTNDDVYILMLDAGGGKKSEKSYGSSKYDCGSSVVATPDGGYLVCGTTDSTGNNGKDGYLIKIDGDGGLMWKKQYGGDGEQEFKSIKRTDDGNYILVGFTTNPSISNGKKDVYILKVNNDGDEMPFPTINKGGVNDDEAFDVFETNNHDIIVVGYTESRGNSSPNKPSGYIIKTDKNGKYIDEKYYDKHQFMRIASGFETYDNGFMLFGTVIKNTSFDKDFLFIKTNSNGDY